jgi:hypothetical protein
VDEGYLFIYYTTKTMVLPNADDSVIRLDPSNGAYRGRPWLESVA